MDKLARVGLWVLAVLGILFVILLTWSVLQVVKAPEGDNPASSVSSSTPMVSQEQNLYFCNTKVGRTENGRIHIEFQDNSYSFAGDPQNLKMLNTYSGCTSLPLNWNRYLVYDDLFINLPAKDELIQITYVCDAPLSGIFYKNCVTNDTDRISEFEFGHAYLQKADKNGWGKIFIKKVGNKNVVFEGDFDVMSISDNLLYADKPSRDPSDFNLVAVHWSDVQPKDLGVYPHELFSLYKRLRSLGLVEDRRIYENNLLYNSDQSWFADLNTIRDNMVRTFTSDSYLTAVTSDLSFKETDAKWKALIDSFQLDPEVASN